MAFCPKCGASLAATVAFCGSCGTAIAATEVKPSPGLVSSTTPVPELSEAWKQKFALLEKAGVSKQPTWKDLFGLPPKQWRNLTFGERFAFFNILGLFGPIYYLAKGMWKKAITLSALYSAIFYALDSAGVTLYFLFPILFAGRANIDYYRKIVCGDNGWW